MAIIYVTSHSDKAGKTMLCAGLGKWWLDKGKRVGFLKPLISNNQAQPVVSDNDALFVAKLLGIKEPLELLCPSIGTQGDVAAVIKQAMATVSLDKDVVIVEGLPINTSASLIEALDAKVMVVHDYSTQLSSSLEEYKKIGGRLLGVVLNKVPKSKVSQMKIRAAEQLSQAGIHLLGLIPEDRILMTMSVADLAEALQGKILNNPDKANELIENVMMGSSTFDRGAAYYSRKNNKAVILWGERPGFRKAAIANLVTGALQTSTKCIVISANGIPLPAIAQKAEAQQIPLISAPGTLPGLISVIENSFSHLKFHQENKLPKLLEILSPNLNSSLLSEELGLPG